MEIKPIRTEADYDLAMERINEILDCDKSTPEWDEFEILVILIEAYEDVEYPIGLPDPIAAIEYELERRGLRVRDLIPCIGDFNTVVAVLEKREPLTLEMIRGLHNEFGISADILIQRYDLAYC